MATSVFPAKEDARMSPLALAACEPIPVIYFGLAGPAASAAFLWRGVAVLVFVVFVKSILFAAFAKCGWGRGSLAMLAANVVTTIAGVLVGVPMAAGPGVFVGYALLAAFAWGAGGWLAEAVADTEWRWLTRGRFFGWSLVLAFVSSALASGLTFGQAADLPIVAYLAMKSVVLFLLFLVSLGMTIGWELAVVAKLTPDDADPDNLVRAAVRANLLTFFGVFLVGAIVAIPIRMRRRDFRYPGGV